jgi:hypothetical protein
MGILAAVRTALFAAPHPQDPAGRVLAVAKSNVGRRPPSLGYRLVESSGQPVVEWTGPVDLTADALCRPAPVTTGVKARDRVSDWLKRELAGGPRRAAELYAAAAAADIPERTLRRAKEDLPAKSHRTYDRAAERGEWYWYDPDAAWPADAPFRKPKPWELPPIPGLEDL